jgi:hypothetical protein
MPIIRGPILISSVSLPVACLASAMCGIFCLRGPVLWLVSSYVATLFLLRAPARTAATGPLAPLVGADARAARSGAVLVLPCGNEHNVKEYRDGIPPIINQRDHVFYHETPGSTHIELPWSGVFGNSFPKDKHEPMHTASTANTGATLYPATE